MGRGYNDLAILPRVVTIPGAIALYFYPAIRALGEHPRATPTFTLNLLAGWTFIGWVAVFIRALNKPEAQPYRRTRYKKPSHHSLSPQWPDHKSTTADCI
jgi:hypothetical protein